MTDTTGGGGGGFDKSQRERNRTVRGLLGVQNRKIEGKKENRETEGVEETRESEKMNESKEYKKNVNKKERKNAYLTADCTICRSAWL